MQGRSFQKKEGAAVFPGGGALPYRFSEKLIAKYPTADIVFLTPLHRAVESQERIKGGVNTFVTLEQYINVMREVLAYYAIPVLDLYKEGKLQPQVPAIKEMYVPDGLHPNDEGHKILAQKITAFLKSHF